MKYSIGVQKSVSILLLCSVTLSGCVAGQIGRQGAGIKQETASGVEQVSPLVEGLLKTQTGLEIRSDVFDVLGVPNQPSKTDMFKVDAPVIKTATAEALAQMYKTRREAFLDSEYVTKNSAGDYVIKPNLSAEKLSAATAENNWLWETFQILEKQDCPSAETIVTLATVNESLAPEIVKLQVPSAYSQESITVDH